MPIRHVIWKVGAEPSPLTITTLLNEQQLEDMIVSTPQILSSEWMLIGRQEQTGLGGRIDLLAIAPDASLVLIELKRDRTPREIVAQALDYASWVERLTADQIAQIYRRFSSGGDLGAAFQQRFGQRLDEEMLNASHQIILVAAELDDSTERIIAYLNDRDIPINVMFFQVFDHGGERLLSRAWMIDPGETQVNAVTAGDVGAARDPWNGEFYASFGGGCTWEDARRFGFISAGGGNWYTQTLKLLSVGDRVWVRIPRQGFVGVGTVEESVQSIHDFKVLDGGVERPIFEVLENGPALLAQAAESEKTERFVRIRWNETIAQTEAFDELGIFGNQNTVCRPATPRWRHTVERLKTVFTKWQR